MNSTGVSHKFRIALFPDGIGGEIMKFILRIWEKGKFAELSLENNMTAVLCHHLNDALDNQPWIFIPELRITDRITGEELGRIDLSFHHAVKKTKGFFTIECKRLRVKSKSGTMKLLAKEYVSDGLARFASGKYGEGRRTGGMIGYVMDGDFKLAMENVSDQVLAQMDVLGMPIQASLSAPSSVLPDHPWSFDTIHTRESGDFVVYHMFLCDVAKYLQLEAARKPGVHSLISQVPANRKRGHPDE